MSNLGDWLKLVQKRKVRFLLKVYEKFLKRFFLNTCLLFILVIQTLEGKGKRFE